MSMARRSRNIPPPESESAPRRGSWYLLTGLLLGLALGALIGLVLLPVQYTDTTPAALNAEYQSQYRLLIARAYAANPDLARARARLELLGGAEPASVLAAQAQKLIGQSGASDDARALALLAQALLQPTEEVPAATEPVSMVLPTDIQPSQEPTAATEEVQAVRSPTPEPTQEERRPTPTPRPSLTPRPTLSSPFKLTDKKELCDPAQGAKLQVLALDGGGEGISGVRVYVSWGVGGQDSFVTGLFPDINPGYADFSMAADTEYTLRLGEAGEPVTRLSSPDCGGAPGGWTLTFVGK